MISATGKPRGFTFIEIFFVIIIIGILAGISAPRLKKAFDNALLGNAALTLQSFLNYLSQRAVVEEKIISLNLNNESKEYWAQFEGEDKRLKSFRLPASVEIQCQAQKILFYPDGQMDKVSIKLIGAGENYIELSSQGAYAKVKILQQK